MEDPKKLLKTLRNKQKKIDNSLEWMQHTTDRLTLKKIKEWLKSTFNLSVCLETVRKLFKKLKLKRKKPQLVLQNADKQDQDEFISLINSLLQREDVKKGLVNIYFHDETTIRETPTKNDVWAYEGQVPELPITGGHQKRIISGAIDIQTGDSMFVSDRKFNQYIFLDFLEELKKKRAEKTTILVIDNYPSHLTNNVKEFFKKEESWLTIMCLPKYSPDLNPIEYVWKYIKLKYCHSKYYDSFEAKLDDIYDAFDFLESNPLEVKKHGSTKFYKIC